MSFLIVPSVSAQSENSGKQLSKSLIESKNPNKTWDQFSDSEKNAVKNFAEPAKDKIQELQEKDVDKGELTKEIKKLPKDLQTAIYVSLTAVNEEVTDEISSISILSNSYNVSHILTFQGVWGNTLAKFTHNIVWYSNGTSVTSGTTSVIPSTPGLGWSYDGLIRNVQNTYSSGYNSDVQGKFSYDISSYNVQNWYPRSQIVGYPDGSYNYTSYN
ncbi:hypothetical protein NC797_06225 [Aquibacillus sp. 3ASR75-11]|uniref:Uncharacterized protein n=1 Tax=Terrihalobacillus insolitus TaxID=2950438 RepID=A0A9X4AN28_9BACI|nr:hypothetical protein [Terrihalobacillus insolitus]MDC3424103.1 hypothetical protein [Terrihalobacillus insolitus]